MGNAMKAPKCHGQLMDKWTPPTIKVSEPFVGQESISPVLTIRRFHVVWRCDECGELKEFYRWPWTWFLLIVDRDHIVDKLVKIKWWMGSTGSFRGFATNEMTFTVIPVNLMIDVATAVWKWLKYRRPGKWESELRLATVRAENYGRANERAILRARLGRIGELVINAGDTITWQEAPRDVERAVHLMAVYPNEDNEP